MPMSSPAPESPAAGFEDRAPEVIAAREAAAIEEATSPQPMPPVTLRPEPATAPERDSAPAEPATGSVPNASTEPDAEIAPGTPTASGWAVAALPDDKPEPQPEPEPEPEPEEPAARRHPALVTGQTRYGESVVREKLGAKFIGEEPIEIAGPSSELDGAIPPDEFEAPPEEY